MEWHEIAIPTGTPDAGWLGLHVNFLLPSPEGDAPASDRQAEAVKLFYSVDFGELTGDQVHALLSCREYSRLSAEALFKNYPAKFQNIVALAIAAFILRDESMIIFVKTWNEKAFSRGSGSPRVRGSPIFEDIRLFVVYLEGCLEMDGWTPKMLKTGSFNSV